MLNTFLSRQENPVAVVNALVKKLNILVSSFTIKQSLQEHPDYPSLLAVSDCLTQWNIPHQAYQIDKTQYQAEELAYPFIAHLSLNGGQFILVQAIAKGQVHYSDEQETKASLSELEFLKRWDGIVLYAEKAENSGEENYKNSLIKGWVNQARLPFLILMLLASGFAAINYSGVNASYLVLLGIKLIGISVSALLLTHSIDAHNPFIQNLCSLGKKNNCNAILKSDAAKVTGWLSWSEVGFFYFAGSLLSLILAPSSLFVLAWLNLACLPYTFYSIAYQIKIKNWCILCCTVQALLWLEALSFAFGLSLPFSFSLSALVFSISALSSKTLLAFLLPIAIWAFIKPFMLKAAQTQPLKQQIKKFKYNSDLFNQLLTTQACYAIPDDLMPIVLGNPDAETVITMVSNPFCGPCATAHKALDNWLAERDDLQLKIIFTTADHDDDQKTKVAKHVTALSLLNDTLLVEKALNTWYTQKDKQYETWAAKYPVSFNGEMAKVTEKQKLWCDGAEIAFTPTILINGYKLIEPYRLEDIKYLI